jgi:hypothetical protein
MDLPGEVLNRLSDYSVSSRSASDSEGVPWTGSLLMARRLVPEGFL